MKGIELSRRLFQEMVMPSLQMQHPELLTQIAIGLVGEGSECYGMDDEISKDHDWGAGICLWLPAETYDRYHHTLQRMLEHLPAVFQGYPVRYHDGKRVGVWETGAFYRQFIGIDHSPSSLREWSAIPENNLSVVTNGEVFFDGAGQFTEIRNRLKEGYPKDILYKKMAYCCFILGQTGQYNFPRVSRRQDPAASWMVEAEFVRTAIRITYLLNHAYPPFYKWSHGLLLSLPVGGKELYDTLLQLIAMHPLKEWKQKITAIEQICDRLFAAMEKAGFPVTKSGSMILQAELLYGCIQSEWVRRVPMAVDH